ncbi:Hypothetical predicted protein [Paramuricea clavata]|uniref:Uncharacterized protein n=1 Tax=Paramuricea clavata TaxID=317549 RepID=A0A6S7GLJ9_PARCT|nr:Hypothetical predicted protein [Paramuricea clavata]
MANKGTLIAQTETDQLRSATITKEENAIGQMKVTDKPSVDLTDFSNNDGTTVKRQRESDPALPVYRWGLTKGMCTDDVAELLVNRCINHSRIATRGPTSVENNAVFVVDRSKIPEKDDLKFDDLGAWESEGSKKLFYSMDGDGKLAKSAKDKLPNKQVGVFVIQRQWRRCDIPNCLVLLHLYDLQNLMLTTKNGNHPVYIGPGILHKQKLKTSYQTLRLLMTKYHQKAAGVLVYGTDGEKILQMHFQTFFHMHNIFSATFKRKLDVQCGITDRPATEIMNDIFGNEIEDQVEGGLIHTTSADEFCACLQSAVCKWTTLHEDYFLKSKAKIIRESARSDIRSMCGFGYPSTLYTQNANECMNRIIKADQDPKSSKHQTALLPYIERIRAEVARQHDEQFLAVLRLGQYRLSDKFSFLRVEENNFFRMNDSQKKALKKKIFTAPVSETRQREEQVLNGELSVLTERSGIISILSQYLMPCSRKLRPMYAMEIKLGKFQLTRSTAVHPKRTWFIADATPIHIKLFGRRRPIAYNAIKLVSTGPPTLCAHTA